MRLGPMGQWRFPTWPLRFATRPFLIRLYLEHLLPLHLIQFTIPTCMGPMRLGPMAP